MSSEGKGGVALRPTLLTSALLYSPSHPLTFRLNSTHYSIKSKIILPLCAYFLQVLEKTLDTWSEVLKLESKTRKLLALPLTGPYEKVFLIQ